MMYTRRRNMGNIIIQSTSINSPSEESLKNLAKEIIGIQSKLRGEILCKKM
nr:hypothetical protein [uncultured Clostridium sp.]